MEPPTPPRPDRDAACLVPRRIRAQTTARTKEALPRSEKGPDSPIRTPRAPLTRLLPSQPFRQLPARRREKLRVVQQIQGLARRTARTLRSDAAAVLGDSTNERSRARGSLKCGNEPRILVYDAEQLIESRRMRDRRL